MNFTPANIDALLSGRRRDFSAAALRTALRLAEFPYQAAVTWRNRGFDRGRRTIHRAELPVISVGNLTTGGTGKTPLVAWLTQWFRTRGVRVAIVSRGYKSRSGEANDEALELANKVPNTPHLQNPDRVAAVNQAQRDYDSQLIILDDAFQHRRLARDLDIVLLDALQPFGYGHLLPRGTLREPLPSLRRAHVIMLTRANLVDEETRHSIQHTAQRYAPDATWVETSYEPQGLRSPSGDVTEISSLTGRSVAAFCGVGNPANFRRTLEHCGVHVAGFREFPDHHPYSPSDLESLTKWAAGFPEVAAVICTDKDLVKIQNTRLGDFPLRALMVNVRISNDAPEFQRQLEQVFEKLRS